MQTLTVLGATGSIGESTLDVVARHPDRFRVFALTGRSRIERLAEQCRQFRPRFAVVSDVLAAERLTALLDGGGVDTEVLMGEAQLAAVSAAPQVDAVMAPPVLVRSP